MKHDILTADEVSVELEQVRYELATESRLARVGLKVRQELAPIVERHAHLFTMAQIDAVREEMDRSSGERHEVQTRIYNALLDGYVDAQSTGLHDEVVSSFALATTSVGGRTYPFHTLVPEISHTTDPALRERLLDGMIEVVAQRNELLTRVHATTESAIEELGFGGYLDYYSAVKRIDYAAFAVVVERTLDLTKALYDKYVNAWVQAELGRPLGDISCAHHYWLRRNHAPAALFPADKMENALRSSLRAFGVNLGAQSAIHIDAADRPTKNPRACVFGARIPGEIHLIVKPTGGKGDYDAFFHEAGHAEHYACTDSELPYAFRGLPVSMAQPELFSFMMENLVNDPAWLQTNLELTPRQARFVAYRAALNDLIMLRRYCAKFMYEYAFCSRSGDGAQLYAAELRRHTGFVYPPAFYQHDRDAGFYSADYLRAWFGHAQVRASLHERFGPRWWGSKDAGATVRDMWRQGVKPDIEDVVRAVGGIPWEAGALLRYYEERILDNPAGRD